LNEYLKRLAELFGGKRRRVDPEPAESSRPSDDLFGWPELEPEQEAELTAPDVGEIDIEGNEDPQRWIPFVASSAVAEAQYSFLNQQVKVRFLKSGAVYVYYGVPPEVWREFTAAPSAGRYFVYNIRNNYEFSRIS